MRAIPLKLRNELAELDRMKVCIYDNNDCNGRIEWEHCWIYKNRQINEIWSIVGVCTHHHRGTGLNKEYNQFVSINLANDNDFAKYPKRDWQQLKKYLNNKYGKF